MNKKNYSMRMLCTEIGNEIYLVHKGDEIINSYEKEEKNTSIYLIISIIDKFYRYYQNTNVSIYDLLQIIFNNDRNNNTNNAQDIIVMNEGDIHRALYNVYLPKISKKRSLPLL